jgi:hypothetical protein
MNKYYAVLKLNTKLTLNNGGMKVDVSLPEGQGYLPVFKTKEEAEIAAGGKFEVVTLLAEKIKP